MLFCLVVKLIQTHLFKFNKISPIPSFPKRGKDISPFEKGGIRGILK